MEIFGVSADAVVAVVVLVGWFVLMKFVLPRMGVST
jgi:p-aminobenzoyl-glutamate transporter AbgT